MIEKETSESDRLHILENYWSGIGSSSLQSHKHSRPVSFILTCYRKQHGNDMQIRHLMWPSMYESITRNKKTTIRDVHIIKWYNLGTFGSNYL